MSKLRKSARGKDCTLELPGCTHDPETTVLAHLRDYENWGIGQKPDDIAAVYACHVCHDMLDNRREFPESERDLQDWYVARALIRTHRQMAEEGLL